MPDVFRPDQIRVYREDMLVGLLPVGSDAYGQLWQRLQRVLTGIRVVGGPSQVTQLPKNRQLSITLALPVSMTLAEWADHWEWDTLGLRHASIKIDRVHFDLGDPAAIYLSGPNLEVFRVGPVPQADREYLSGMVDEFHPSLFEPYRPLDSTDHVRRVVPGVLVPDVNAVPVGTVLVQKPQETTEVIRYFPDLSVVRQIDEKDARSFTDGRRLLRIRSTGILEYRTANVQGLAPGISRALAVAREWVGTRGGWPQNVVLGAYVQQPGRTVLEFALRANGPYPVHSDNAAVQVEVTADRNDLDAYRVTYLKRLPDMRFIFEGRYQPIISPEKALAEAFEAYPRELLFDYVREIFIAYRVRVHRASTEQNWIVDPVWVFQVGEKRLYVPAVRPEHSELHSALEPGPGA